MRTGREGLQVREASITPADPSQAYDQGQCDDGQENQSRIRFVFFVIFEKIIQVASLVRGRAQVEHPARVSRRGIRGVGFPGDWGS